MQFAQNMLSLSTPSNDAILKTNVRFVGIYVDPKYSRNLCVLRSLDKKMFIIKISRKNVAFSPEGVHSEKP